MSDSSVPPDERRQAPRRRTLLGGIVIHGPAGMTLDCAIRNLSDSGARIRITGHEALGRPVALLAYSLDQAFEADVVWQHDSEAGLAFTRPLDLHNPETELAKTARRLWLERRFR